MPDPKPEPKPEEVKETESAQYVDRHLHYIEDIDSEGGHHGDWIKIEENKDERS